MNRERGQARLPNDGHELGNVAVNSFDGLQLLKRPAEVDPLEQVKPTILVVDDTPDNLTLAFSAQKSL
jgi:hypothetical protein